MKSDFQLSERVRRSDVDGSGTIGFAAYARLVEVAEHESLRSLGFDAAAFRRMGIELRHVHLDFDFFKPVGIDEMLTVRTRIAGVGVHSVRMKIDVLRASDGAQSASLTLVAACVDSAGRSASMPAELAQALRARLSED
jgi:YbgC/YbaW family acyl-CoA thioester hydrolase